MRDFLTSRWGRILQAIVGLVLIIGGTSFGGDEGALMALVGVIPCVSAALKLGERREVGEESG